MDLRDAVMTAYPARRSLIARSRHVWDRYIGWGSAHPLKRRAMRQLAVSAIMSAIADTTMDFIAREPAQAKRYTKGGFDAFWKGVAG
jgi:hypothetical protein